MTTEPTILTDSVAQSPRSSEPSALLMDEPPPLAAELLKRVKGQGTRYLARAPGRLDVMGGIAEYTGSLVLNWPVEGSLYVAVQGRSDRNVSITRCTYPATDSADPNIVALTRLREAAGSADKLADYAHDESWDTTTRIVVAVLVEMFRGGYLPQSFEGASLVTGSTLNQSADLGQVAALGAATIAALCRIAGTEIEPMDAARLTQRVENHYFDMPCGIGDAVTALMGEPACLTQLRCQPHELNGTLRLPTGVVLVGIDCGLTAPDAAARYRRVRTTTYMGRTLIERIMAHEPAAGRIDWEGYLARLTMTDFVERFRDRLPTKMTGKDFLSRFGETGDPVTRIEPAIVYKIRSRTEHHVYENARAIQFAERLGRSARTGDRRITVQAGLLMYASHWSYSQRCGLGSTASDRLVTSLRRRGPQAGILGAKIAGRACGGLVVVLMDDTPQAFSVVDDVRRQYEVDTGRTTSLLNGSSAGVIPAGVREIT